MGVFRKGKNWWIDYYVGIKRVREMVGPDKQEAAILHAERLKDIRHGRNPELKRIAPKPFADFLPEFLEKHAKAHKDYESFVTRTNALKRSFEYYALQEIDASRIRNYINARLGQGVSHATVNRERACLSKMFNCAKEWGYFGGDNPVSAVKPFKESVGRTRWLTAAEAEALVACAANHLKPIITCALHTGGRLLEILTLVWDQVDLVRGYLHFDAHQTKDNEWRAIPLDSVLLPMLQGRSKVREISGDGHVFTLRGKHLQRLTTSFTTARRVAGLGPDVTFHTLRHTFASWYMINGGDIYRLQKYLGHSDIKLTQRYAHLSRDYHQAGTEFFGPPRARKEEEHAELSDSQGGR